MATLLLIWESIKNKTDKEDVWEVDILLNLKMSEYDFTWITGRITGTNYISAYSSKRRQWIYVFHHQSFSTYTTELTVLSHLGLVHPANVWCW